MSVVLWILQILFALHTAMGGVWKFTNPVATSAPSLVAIPTGAWMALGVLDLLAAVGLLLPLFNKSWTSLAVIAALYVLAEMILFIVVQLASGFGVDYHIGYWIVVAVVSVIIVWGRRA